MRVAFGKKLCGIQRASLLDNAVHEELMFAPEQDDVPAAHILNRNLPDQGDILRPHPRLHAGAVNAQGNPATPLQRIRNAQRIVGAAFPADPRRFFSVLPSILHQTSLLKFRRPRLFVPAIQRDAGTSARIEVRARTILACSEREQIHGRRSESKLVQLLISEWSLEGGRSMDGKYLLAQSYSINRVSLSNITSAPEGCLRFLYDRRGAPLQTPP